MPPWKSKADVAAPTDDGKLFMFTPNRVSWNTQYLEVAKNVVSECIYKRKKTDPYQEADEWENYNTQEN